MPALVVVQLALVEVQPVLAQAQAQLALVEVQPVLAQAQVQLASAEVQLVLAQAQLASVVVLLALKAQGTSSVAQQASSQEASLLTSLVLLVMYDQMGPAQ